MIVCKYCKKNLSDDILKRENGYHAHACKDGFTLTLIEREIPIFLKGGLAMRVFNDFLGEEIICGK